MQIKKSLKLGVTLSGNTTSFCFYCPNAEAIRCVIFDSYDSKQGMEHPMQMDESGFWMLTIHGNLKGKWYGYRVIFNGSKSNDSPYTDKVFADPYSKHVTVKNNYKQEARTYIFQDNFDWEDSSHCFPDDIRDLIIYETHLKDLVAHPNSLAKGKGYYQKFISGDQQGGIKYLKKLGVNCVEFLPLQKFSPIEPPYGIQTKEGFHNTWNRYSENYWGYMTSFFFAPESSFASDYSHSYSGKTTSAVSEFKEVVKSLHAEGITVLMDVVYNHTSLFDMNPLTHLMPDVYLRKDDKGKWMNRSGTGNEFKSEEPIARKMIIDSLLHWMDEYKIDGFRFDLAALLDKKTWDSIKNQIHKKYPKAILIAEPWGGYYSPDLFSKHDWASWNDRIRNSIKGSDPLHNKGFIFSDWQHETRRERLENVMKGTLTGFEGGLYQTSEHCVNYLESHDGYTLGDFIRIGLNPENQDQVIENRDTHIKLKDEELKIAKLAALTLFTAQGTTMIHAGQEYARSKIIAKTPCGDPDVGKMDHNSYEKNNETNWLNFNDVKINQDLFDYYHELIKIRQEAPALRKSASHDVCFDYYGDPIQLSFFISGESTGDMYNYYIILNGNATHKNEQHLPPGTWEVLVNHEVASTQTIDVVSNRIEVPPRSGFLLRKLRH
ncbi:MAG: alpha-amylase family glycosyl hydrolase [Balneolaceae bacterium]